MDLIMFLKMEIWFQIREIMKESSFKIWLSSALLFSTRREMTRRD